MKLYKNVFGLINLTAFFASKDSNSEIVVGSGEQLISFHKNTVLDSLDDK